MTEEDVLPVAAGDWVASLDGHSFQIGKVKACYTDTHSDPEMVMIDLVLYDVNGNKIGRSSPVLGGPRSFEPCLTYTGFFRRIEKPEFPIQRTMRNKPTDDPAWSSVSYDYHDSVKAKPERTAVVNRKRPGNGGGRTVNYDPELERAALRRAAQELRDLARQQPSAAAALKARAAELEADAAAAK